MIVTEKMASYGALIVAMKKPEFSQCVTKTRIGRPDIDTYGMTGYIPVDIEFEVYDIKVFADLWHSVNRDEKYTNEINEIQSRLGFRECYAK